MLRTKNAKNYLEFYAPSIDSTQKLLQQMPIHILFLHCHELKSVHSPLGNTGLSLDQRRLLVQGDSHLLPPILPASTRKEARSVFWSKPRPLLVYVLKLLGLNPQIFIKYLLHTIYYAGNGNTMRNIAWSLPIKSLRSNQEIERQITPILQ